MHWTNQWTTNPFTVAMTSMLTVGSHWMAAWRAAAQAGMRPPKTD